MTPFQKSGCYILTFAIMTDHDSVVSLERDKEKISFLKHTLDSPMDF